MAPVIRHGMREGSRLVLQRPVVAVVLGVVLAFPIAGAGITASAVQWLASITPTDDERTTVPVLLRPELTSAQRGRWIDEVAARYPDWSVTLLRPEEVASRLVDWFPSVADVIRADSDAVLPVVVEIGALDSRRVAEIRNEPEVLAVGPTDPVGRRLARFGRAAFTWSLAVCSVLLAAAVLLAGVWVHLELYRYADELAIMRLVGATEAAVRAPFLVAVSAPGALAAVVAPVCTVAAVRGLATLLGTLGLATWSVPWWVVAGQVTVAVVAPLAVAWWVISRHGNVDPETG